MSALETAATRKKPAPHRHRPGDPRRGPRQGHAAARRRQPGASGPPAYRRVSRLRGLHRGPAVLGGSGRWCKGCAASARSAIISPPSRRWTPSPAITSLTPTAEKLRRLMHYGQILQSHAVHFFHLASPDLLLGFDSEPTRRNIVGVAAEFPDIARQGVLLRKFGQEVIRHTAGKRIHGTGAIPGGVNKALTVAERDELRARHRPDDRLGARRRADGREAASRPSGLLRQLRRVSRPT